MVQVVPGPVVPNRLMMSTTMGVAINSDQVRSTQLQLSIDIMIACTYLHNLRQCSVLTVCLLHYSTMIMYYLINRKLFRRL
jgi:hypothetical protein